MSIITIKFSEIKPNDKNPRFIKDDKFEKMVQSILDFPEMLNIRHIVLDEKKISLGGNMRYHGVKHLKEKKLPEREALEKKQLNKMRIQLSDPNEFGRYQVALHNLLFSEEIQVMQEMGLSEERKKELIIKDNLEFGEWDHDILSSGDWDLDKLLNWGLDPFEHEQEIQEDDFDAEAHIKAIEFPLTKFGDQYEFINRTNGTLHRLRCGSSEDPEDWKALMDGELGRLIFTDPPYNVDYESPTGKRYESKEYGGTGNEVFDDNKTDADATSFYTNVLRNLYNHTVDEACIYWFFAFSNVKINQQAWVDSGFYVSQMLIWLKEMMVFSIGQDFHRLYEPILFGWKKGKAHFKVRKYGKMKNVFHLEMEDFKSLLDIWYEKRDNINSYIHPTQRPVRLIERSLKRHSVEGDIVLDAFSGSGSSLMGCEMMKRNARVMEIDPKFCDANVKRFAKWCTENSFEYSVTKNGEPINPEEYNHHK